METKVKLPRFPELDGLRGLAALAVVIHHFLRYADGRPQPAWSPLIVGLLKASEFGASGVDVFFVLSGFLITALLLVDRQKTNYFNNFYWKRALRILPVYFVHLLMAQLIVGQAGGYFLLAIFFLVNFADPLHVDVKGVAWTLSIEEQFYLLWPQFVRRLRLSQIYYMAFAVVVVSVTLRTLMPLIKGSINESYTFYRCDGLGLGAILALQWFSAEGRTRPVNRVLSALNANATLVAVILLQIWAMTLAVNGLIVIDVRIWTISYLSYRIILRIVFQRERQPWHAWLGTPVFAYLGAVSYGMYMYHDYVLVLFDRYLGHVNPSLYGPTALRFLVTFAVILLVCTVSRYGMELPAQKLRRFILRPSHLDPAIEQL